MKNKPTTNSERPESSDSLVQYSRYNQAAVWNSHNYNEKQADDEQRVFREQCQRGTGQQMRGDHVYALLYIATLAT